MVNEDFLTDDGHPLPALYIYEWLVTLDEEVKYIWTRKWALSTWIFAVNRYVPLAVIIVTLSPSATREVCSLLTCAKITHSDIRISVEVGSMFCMRTELILIAYSCTWAEQTLHFFDLMQFVVTAGRLSISNLMSEESTNTSRTRTAFSGLRVYALCNRNIWLFSLVFTLSMVSFGVNLVSVI